MNPTAGNSPQTPSTHPNPGLDRGTVSSYLPLPGYKDGTRGTLVEQKEQGDSAERVSTQAKESQTGGKVHHSVRSRHGRTGPDRTPDRVSRRTSPNT